MWNILIGLEGGVRDQSRRRDNQLFLPWPEPGRYGCGCPEPGGMDAAVGCPWCLSLDEITQCDNGMQLVTSPVLGKSSGRTGVFPPRQMEGALAKRG